MNYLISLMYDGAAYHGWQIQKNAVSVQEKVEGACAALFGCRTTVYGCSRTDTGVHANCFKANFFAEKEMDFRQVVSALNFYLPDDIVVTDCRPVDDSFNARFDCVSKEYIYKIYNAPLPNPFYNGRALQYKYPLDEQMLDRQAADFVGTHDFSALRAMGSTVKTTTRTVYYANVERHENEVIFRVAANGFLYNMVRIMAGTLLYISEGKIPADSIPAIIASRDRLRAGKTLPPEGLYLNKVTYAFDRKEGD